ncbi:condensation domain-containing protein [Streptomyces sp. NPDC057575]|uniref:condensation domain-containing protein n=1 Tax=unclassified Streptomyces TaxID=2593676 RepID=UPI0036B66452
MTGSMTVVISSGMPPALELRGPLDPAALARALAELPGCTPTLRRHTATHHTLYLSPRHLPAGALGDLLTAFAGPPGSGASTDVSTDASTDAAGAPVLVPLPGPEEPSVSPVQGEPHHSAAALFPASPRQREILLDLMTAAPGTAPYVEQQHWRWYGPLDTRRYRAAWASVADREAVLRGSFARADAPDGPRVTVHPKATPRVVRHPYGSVDRKALLGSERLTAFDPLRPGPLRVLLIDEQPGTMGPVRVVVTYHHAFIDGPSVRMLLRAVHRAYLADGPPPGGQRRPDLRDHLDWLDRQDTAPAREFWTRAAPPADAAILPSRPSGTPSRPGHGRTGQRLTPHEAIRLRHWAGDIGVTECTALHAAWALLLHRASGRTGPAPVAFGMTVSGRGILLDGAALLPGPLRNPLPLSTEVDPAMPLARLLSELGERAMDMAAYEWVSEGQVHAWSGRPAEDRLTGTVIAFEPPASLAPPATGDPLRNEFDAQDIRLTPPETVPADTGLPLSLTAHHDADGGLALTAVNDRTRLADPDAATALAQTALLLREFPRFIAAGTPVAEVLALLGPAAPARTHHPGPAQGPTVLRPATRPGAGTVLLVPPPDAPVGCYDELARIYPGPQTLLTVNGAVDAAGCLAALRPALAAAEPVTFGCYSGGGALAYEVAQQIAGHGWLPPPVAIAGTAAAAEAGAAALSRTLAEVAGAG